MSEWWREAIEKAQTFQEIEAVFHRLWPELAKNREAVTSKLTETTASEGAAIYKEMQPAARKAIEHDYDEWLIKALSSSKPKRDYALLGAMDEKDVAFLEARGNKPDNAAIIINDRLISGQKAERHKIRGNALTVAEWGILPKVVNDPERVLYDTTDGKLLYVYPSLTDPRHIKVVVEQGVYDKKLKGSNNVVNTVFKIDGNALEDEVRYERVR